MAWYVDESGNIYTYEMASPRHIRLSNGVEIDPDATAHKGGDCFATEVSAKQYSKLIKEVKDPKIARALHTQWVRDKGYEREV